MKTTFLLLTVLALTSCAAESDAPDPPAAAANTGAPEAPGETAPIEDALQAPPATPEGEVALAVEGEGLRVFVVASGSARPVPFDTPIESVLEILRTTQGQPPREQARNFDCQLDYASWDDGLTVWSADGRFVGWSLRGGTGMHSTASGIGIGSTRTELEAAYDAEIGESSLGVEFSAGGLAGVLDSREADAKVVNLWAGVTCIAR